MLIYSSSVKFISHKSLNTVLYKKTAVTIKVNTDDIIIINIYLIGIFSLIISPPSLNFSII
ncbi:hypothetical protein JOC61_000736 [Marinitoga litoralis]|nr:hypothetical protein [Marinitoga litoralis]